MDTKKIANVRITPELLIVLLNLPPDTKIINAFWDDKFGGCIVICITQHDLPDVLDGDEIPYVLPIIRHNREFEFLEWVPR